MPERREVTMTHPGDPDLHFWLTRSVGRSIGLNFSEALHEGRLTARRYADLVATCRTCPHVARCQAWLAETAGPGTIPRAPDFCPIGPALNALKPH
jgi:hypothetical protein